MNASHTSLRVVEVVTLSELNVPRSFPHSHARSSDRVAGSYSIGKSRLPFDTCKDLIRIKTQQALNGMELTRDQDERRRE
jgi:hypothetical protein